MILRRQLRPATAQILRATWLQVRADAGQFVVQFGDYTFGKNNNFVGIECTVFYADNEVPFQRLNARRHHISLFEVDGRLTHAEKSQLPVSIGQKARGFKLYSGQGNPCKTALLVDVSKGFLLQLDAFLQAIVKCRWAGSTDFGTKLHVSL